MTDEIALLSDDVSTCRYGSKAYWLSWLYRHGYRVPDAIFLPAAEVSAEEYIASVARECDLRAALARFLNGTRYQVAVRSSATSEDTRSASMAGHFQTVVGTFTIDEVYLSIKEVVASRDRAWTPEGTEIAVIVQRLVESAVSGVAFSSDPISGSKKKLVISSAAGFGEALVSGHADSVETIIDKESGAATTTGANLLDNNQLHVLADACAAIERELEFPVDLEWCVENDTGRVYFLQCRPATGMLHLGSPVVTVAAASHELIPRSLRAHKKVALRMIAEEHAIPISPAYLIFTNCRGETPVVPSTEHIQMSARAHGFSAVLVAPERIDGGIVRRFTDESALQNTVAVIAKMAAAESWSSAIIVQEIYDPEITGIGRRVGEQFVLDVGLGHFIPKGVVPVSEYILSGTGELLHSQEVSTDHYYRISGGTISTERIPSGTMVALLPEILGEIVQLLRPILESADNTVEFGVICRGERKPFIYLIDLVQENVAVPDAQMIEDGVMSRGTITGRLVTIQGSETSTASLDLHQQDETPTGSSNDVALVYASELPALSLLDLVKSADPSRIGFVFRKGSVLCHLAIVLRERGIPAVRIDDFERLVDGQIVTIDADASGHLGSARVKVQ